MIQSWNIYYNRTELKEKKFHFFRCEKGSRQTPKRKRIKSKKQLMFKDMMLIDNDKEYKMQLLPKSAKVITKRYIRLL